MWVAAIDFKKAFDSFQHEAIRNSLRKHSISEQYNCLPKKLYTDQRATVLTDVESDEFNHRSWDKTRRLLERSPLQLGSPICDGMLRRRRAHDGDLLETAHQDFFLVRHMVLKSTQARPKSSQA